MKENTGFKQSSQQSFKVGSALKVIREKKGIQSKSLSDALIISPSHLTKIEKDERSISADLLMKSLRHLNISFEELSLQSDSRAIKSRIEIKKNLASFVIKKNQQQIQALIKKTQDCYNEYNDSYFNHVNAMLRALLALETTSYNYDEARMFLKPISNYLDSVESWYEYEVTLFSNCCYLYPIDEAIKKGMECSAKLQKNTTSFLYEEIVQNLFLNLSIYALDTKEYCADAIEFSSKALTHQSRSPLYTLIMAKIIHQIAYYKMESAQYDEVHFTNLIKGLKLLNIDSFTNQVLTLLEKHGIELKNL